MKKLAFLVTAVAIPLTGCATTSFAPPSVNLETEMKAEGSNRRFSQWCMPVVRTVNDDGQTSIAIQPNVEGARKLIDNFIYMYRCSAHRAANGRQGFEIPSFLSLVGATTAAAFGAGPNVAIAGGAANSIFSAGKSYYDPKMKAEIFDHSLDALLCIKTEAVGVDALEIQQLEASEKGLREQVAAMLGSRRVSDKSDELSVSPQKQYFDLVSASLLSVERVLAHRLSNVGTFDPAGVVAQIEKLNREIRNKGEDPAEGGGESGGDARNAEAGGSQTGNDNSATDQMLAQVAKSFGTNSTALESTKIDLKVLKPKLEKCVLRAKM
jgi:hypothetical protein